MKLKVIVSKFYAQKNYSMFNNIINLGKTITGEKKLR